MSFLYLMMIINMILIVVLIFNYYIMYIITEEKNEKLKILVKILKNLNYLVFYVAFTFMLIHLFSSR